MTIKTKIQVMNNVSMALDSIDVSTSCVGSISFFIPSSNGPIEMELNRKQLIEFLIRTMPAFQLGVKIDAYAEQEP